MISEAREVGLIDSKLENIGDSKYFSILEKVSKKNIEKSPSYEDPGIYSLQNSVKKLDDELIQIEEKLNDAKKIDEEISLFSKESDYQKQRLSSIDLLDHIEENVNSCPFCKNPLSDDDNLVKSIRDSLIKLDKSISSATKERPRIKKYLEKLEKDKQNLIVERKQLLLEINAIYDKNRILNKARDIQLHQAEIIGRIKFWLDNVDLSDKNSPLNNLIDDKKTRISEIEKILDESKIKQKTDKLLEEISLQITKWAKLLSLEHSDSPLSLDFDRMKLFVNRNDLLIPFNKIGSGKNWMGYHIITHLALHSFFIKHKRSIPNFLILDQPSQVFFPQEKSMKNNPLTDDDRESLSKIFNLIFETVSKLNPNLQIIITEHAEFDNPEFQSLIRERWRTVKH